MSSTDQPTIFPCIYYNDAPAAIEWLARAFGFTKRLVVPGENGTIIHAEMSLGAGVIMPRSARPGMGLRSPQDLPAVNQMISVYVEDPDAHHAQAQAAGAEITQALKDEVQGRGYGAKDLEGHPWYFGNYRPGAAWSNP
jgi:uncharacterized glyoxalase superfamily protein PhnB